jgi:hypothetical protein
MMDSERSLLIFADLVRRGFCVPKHRGPASRQRWRTIFTA